MVIRITWGKLRAGAWGDFERTYRATVVARGKNVKGLRGRWLAQDAGDQDTGFAVSLWDGLPAMQAYEQSPLYAELVAPLQPFFVGEYRTYRCQVKYAGGTAASEARPRPARRAAVKPKKGSRASTSPRRRRRPAGRSR